jgi:hypothetical protein
MVRRSRFDRLGDVFVPDEPLTYIAPCRVTALSHAGRGHLNGCAAPLRNLDHPASEATRCLAQRMGIRW